MSKIFKDISPSETAAQLDVEIIRDSMDGERIVLDLAQ
jgi:hypothetical protein